MNTAKRAVQDEVVINTSLNDAVSFGLWLIKDKGWSLVNAVKKASEKKGYKTKSHIEAEIRKLLPADFFTNRSLAQFKSNISNVNNVVYMKSEQSKQKGHMRSISSE